MVAWTLCPRTLLLIPLLLNYPWLRDFTADKTSSAATATDPQCAVSCTWKMCANSTFSCEFTASLIPRTTVQAATRHAGSKGRKPYRLDDMFSLFDSICRNA